MTAARRDRPQDRPSSSIVRDADILLASINPQVTESSRHIDRQRPLSGVQTKLWVRLHIRLAHGDGP